MIESHMRKNLNANYIKGLQDLISYLPDSIDMIEIGCYAGESTELFLQSGKVKSICCIDPYIDCYDLTDGHSRHYPMQKVFEVFEKRILQVYDNVTLYQMTSEKAINKIKGEYDYVYSDGNHQYEATKSDIELYFPLIKPKGIIAGHDYNDAWDSVRRAVNEKFGPPHKLFKDDSWMIMKGNV